MKPNSNEDQPDPSAGSLSTKAGGKRAGAGRKPVDIDLVSLEKLCTLNCTDDELAAYFGVSARTIQKRRKNDPQFASATSVGRAKGRITVRRKQMQLLEAGNATMAVWLGKQLLGQRDVTPVELTGANRQPVQITLEILDAFLDQSAKSKATRHDR
jgi:hypothetical protein